ncbi:zinc finger A20 and AN1 domain-containing stress-associated protein 2 isoform X2 [Drosophila navojoa]|uniref:zinc finger A20 and AN1 domain-containing stress-associated protein 2 isoform X3 n=1 Tax=Drosophila navojoa TaxID=7232 RepID=UPI0008463045|nr:zinc finger A20 and AN1 domain-containing stress-associated protein 2 isoform X3 [Drosophila navojoa]XP_017964298.1 zinc finger A20 and AN1 domain-containing stress-associated protein 2 isoform X2 [Drosophila navojoa]
MHIHLLAVQTLGSRSRLGQQNSTKIILKALTIESENPVKMDNGKIRDFANAKGGTTESISTDGNTARTIKSKRMDGRAPLDMTPGTGAALSPLSICVEDLTDEHQPVDEQEEGGNQQPSGGESEQAAAPSADDSGNGQAQEQPSKKGCDKCGKKFGLTGGFPCRCGGTYCAFHRYSDRHECTFDYREMGATEIRRDNPVVAPEKLRKL